MVFKDYTFISYVFSATAIILLLAGHAHGAGLCDNSPNKQVCDSIVDDRTDPRKASSLACQVLVYVTKVAKEKALSLAKSVEIDLCILTFDDAIVFVKDALKGLEASDYANLRYNLNYAHTDYQACNEVFQQTGNTNPIAEYTKDLEDTASVGAYLVTLIT